MVNISYDNQGRIRRMSRGYGKIGVVIEDWPKGRFGKESTIKQGMVHHLFYRPATPDDAPPKEYDEKPSGWHPASTDVIGIVFTKPEKDEKI